MSETMRSGVCMSSDDNIYKRSADGSGSWQHIAGKLKHVSASGNGYIWGVSSTDQIYKCKNHAAVRGFMYLVD